MTSTVASVIGEARVSLGERRFLFLTLVGFVCAFGFIRLSTDGPWYAIYAVLFGIGLGLAIDKYALWLHLDDVYWSGEGRSSIDATLVAWA